MVSLRSRESRPEFGIESDHDPGEEYDPAPGMASDYDPGEDIHMLGVKNDLALKNKESELALLFPGAKISVVG